MLKRAAVSDVDLVVTFEAEVADPKLYGEPLGPAAVASEILASQYYLHLVNDSIAATGALRWRDDGSVYLSNVAVHPRVRRKGYARAMMCHLLRHCHGANDRAQSIDLAVHPDNTAARALYVSLGFVPDVVRENYFGDGEPRLIMRLRDGASILDQPRS
jgi:ribosomal protein S18 acetylase RimI-like enzyme